MASPYGISGRNALDPIEIPDDDDPILPEDQRRIDIAQQVRNYLLHREHQDEAGAAFGNAPSEDDQEDDIVAELREVIDLTGDRPEPISRYQGSYSTHAAHPSPKKRHQSVHFGGKKVKVNFVYELNDTQGHQFALGFIRVTEIWEHTLDKTFHVHGIPYTRNRVLHGKLSHKLNEVCMVLEVYKDDQRPLREQACIKVPISSLGGPRRLHVTNAPYPLHRWDPKAFPSKDEVEVSGPLVCRWKVIYEYLDDQPRRKPLSPRSFKIIRIRAEDVTEPELRYSDEALRRDWRGETVRGGSYQAPRGPVRAGTVNRAPNQRYTLFDAFCGAGGVSRGAERSGLHVQYAVDVWDKACSSMRMNFPDTEVFETDIYGFITSTDGRVITADVVHLSPPCQFWSPAHTVNGPQDDANIAALFACRAIIEKVRPRIFTLEQTFGIMRERFADSFNCLISGFTDHNYSVEWKVIECEYYGLPQHRRRLIMIGAGPGEVMPPWPAITHARGGQGGLKPFNTIRKALRPIAQVRNDPHHRPRPCPPSKDSVVSDPDDILKRCMTTSGGQNRHFDKTRTYTNREFACLQGFPIWHQFTKTCARRQIGNAFPPCVVQVFYEAIQKHLYQVDGFTGNPRPVLPVIPRDIISLVDEGEEEDDSAMEDPPSYRASANFRPAPINRRDVVDMAGQGYSTGLRPNATVRRRPALVNVDLTPSTHLRPRSQPTPAPVASSQLDLEYRTQRRRQPNGAFDGLTLMSREVRQDPGVMEATSSQVHRYGDSIRPTYPTATVRPRLDYQQQFPLVRPRLDYQQQFPHPYDESMAQSRYGANGRTMGTQASASRPPQPVHDGLRFIAPSQRLLRGSFTDIALDAWGLPPVGSFRERHDASVLPAGMSHLSRTASLSGTPRRGAMQAEYSSPGLRGDDQDQDIIILDWLDGVGEAGGNGREMIVGREREREQSGYRPPMEWQ
ncbi:hypothetical protein VD0002_g3908 [Verticillium dahliae]|uniref:DNA (cytosine-5-)-methyltransferase n=2 Tax=Verticillium dahliae TaxID=27337 RepID=G2WVZ7_VERDV|nr:modification methylase Sau96I [Verticillium dahliae VdLs.17]KAF3350249.1 Serine/threonine-protein kinase cot-1 [Verticillium dahliae VDG2]KAH6706072.1 modification methylase Sau96I [Verticillium dahliae]EGY19767.1 modification methylase Sau96I [Verticillium dahliae VdLs.17]PNH33072.1 hypothetical protein BJF96_g3781 [Verticillium dahliae]PNH40640.1 hypothetical protein VD0004_g6366 [Verticillium dahliae]